MRNRRPVRGFPTCQAMCEGIAYNVLALRVNLDVTHNTRRHPVGDHFADDHVAAYCPGRPINRRYSWVIRARIRCATMGSHSTWNERQRSTAARRSLRKATQAGQLSICALICSQVRGSTRLSRYSERLANSSRHSAGLAVIAFSLSVFCSGNRLSSLVISFLTASLAR
jgi:hypothetical protein